MKFLIFAFFLSSLANAEIMEEQCSREADNYGGQNMFTHECEMWIFKNSTVRKGYKNYNLFGWKNVIVLTSSLGVSFYAGPNTELKEVMDASFDDKLKKIAVLNFDKHHRQVLIFDTKLRGDVAPSIILESPLLQKVYSVAFMVDQDILQTKSEGQNLHWELNKDSRVVGKLSPLEANKSPEKENVGFSIFSFLGFSVD